MLSRFSAKWHWYDWLFITLALLVIAAAVRVVAPTSGLSISLHTGTRYQLGGQWLSDVRRSAQSSIERTIMLIEEHGIEWVGERIQLRLFDLDGRHETIFLFPSEAIDLLGWLLQERDTLLRLNAEHIDEHYRIQEEKKRRKDS